jgi:SAM-dependent methyltransferase
MRSDLEKTTHEFAAMLAHNGATPAAVGYPNATDLAARYELMLAPLESMKSSTRPIRLLDLGCGPGLLIDYLVENGCYSRIDYLGVDVVPETIQAARARLPGSRFDLRDVRDQPFGENAFDYAIISGVFTYRSRLDYRSMETMVHETLCAVWPSVELGLTFNVMSKHVDWERDELFHWPLDDLMSFCKSNLSRHVSLRLDYGPWETVALVMKAPITVHSKIPQRWFQKGGQTKSQ